MSKGHDIQKDKTETKAVHKVITINTFTEKEQPPFRTTGIIQRKQTVTAVSPHTEVGHCFAHGNTNPQCQLEEELLLAWAY